MCSRACVGGPLSLLLIFLVNVTNALDNGLRLPPMGWSSWYGFTSHIDEIMLRDMADAMISSGLHNAGYEHIWIDDGYAIGRDNDTGRIIVDPALFPSGMRNLSDYLHDRNLKFGVYTSKGPKTCLGYQNDQPDRPGSCGHEQIDADTYANLWQVDQVKDDGCGDCPQHEPFAAMRDALNRTGRSIWLAINAGTQPSLNATVANDWRTGPDLASSTYETWVNRLDRATRSDQRAAAGPGAFPNPDFLEVGYSPRAPKGGRDVQTQLEQRSMFTMWAALPAPLILSADLRPGVKCGGVDDDYTIETLTNREVIAVNQDVAAWPMRPVVNDTTRGVQVWMKPLNNPEELAVILFHRSVQTTGPMPDNPSVLEIVVPWLRLGVPISAEMEVRDLWAKETLGTFRGSFVANVTEREARIYKFTRVEDGVSHLSAVE